MTAKKKQRVTRATADANNTKAKRVVHIDPRTRLPVGWSAKAFTKENIERIHAFLEDSKAGRTAPVLLPRWFRHDTWHANDAILLLLGLDGAVIRNEPLAHPSDDNEILSPVEKVILKATRETVAQIRAATFLDSREIDYASYEVARDAFRKKAQPTIEDIDEVVRLQEEVAGTLELLSEQYRDMLAVWQSGISTRGYSGDFAIQTYPPDWWIAWAQSKGFVVPWLEWARLAGLIKPNKDERPLSTKERNTMLRLILGLARLNYGGDGLNFKKIAEELALKGVEMDDGTVGKYLKEAEALEPKRRD